MMNKTTLLSLAAGLIIGIAAGYYFGQDESPEPVPPALITSFEECAAAGYPIMESYPEQCRSPEGQNFVRVIPDMPAEPAPVPQEPVACTMEAMLCPDGSAVGRTGPNCEFAPCP